MIKMNIGKNIKSYRKLAGLSQEELAKKIGVGRSTISSWEVDRTEPSLKDVNSIADALHCSEDALLGDWKDRAMREMDRYNVYRDALRSLGWDEVVVNQNGDTYSYELAEEEGNTWKSILTNGTISFEISAEDANKFENDISDFVAKRIQELMIKASRTIAR